jgi:hypothetical protein
MLTAGHGISGTDNTNAFQFDGFYDPVWSPDRTKVLSVMSSWRTTAPSGKAWRRSVRTGADWPGRLRRCRRSISPTGARHLSSER